MTKIAVTSCCNIKRDKNQIAWSRIEDESPDLLLMLGDNVYTRNRGWDPEHLNNRYRTQFGHKRFRSLIDKTPFLAIWDDHDFGPNNAYGGDTTAINRVRARDVFWKHMESPLIDKRQVHSNKPHIYCSYVLDDLKIIMLDTRFFREDWAWYNPWPELLGKQQERWLWGQLEHGQKYTLVCAGSTIGSNETESENLRFYEGFYKTFRSALSAAPNPLFLAGDIHRNLFCDHTLHGDRFYEVISSGVGQTRKGGKTPYNCYAMLDFQPEAVTIQFSGHQAFNRCKVEIDPQTWEIRSNSCPTARHDL